MGLGQRHYVFRLLMSVYVCPFRTFVNLSSRLLEKYWRCFPKLAALVHFGTRMNAAVFGVKVQGHSKGPGGDIESLTHSIEF